MPLLPRNGTRATSRAPASDCRVRKAAGNSTVRSTSSDHALTLTPWTTAFAHPPHRVVAQI